MHSSKQKKFTYRIGVPVVLASMMFLAEGAHGIDLMQRIVTNQYEKLMKERETVYDKEKNTLVEEKETLEEEKKTLVQELNQQKEEMKLTELSLKSVIGGAEDTPILEEVKKLVGIVKEDAVTLEEALDSLNENLRDVTSPTLVGKVEVLKETLAVTQDIMREIEETTGGSGTGTPLLPRIQRLRSSSDSAKGLKEKLVDVPGEELSEKVEILMAERERDKEKLEKMEQAILAKEETINDLKESLEEMEETIIDKEETINDLHVELLIAQTEIKSLDEQASLGQVALSQKTTQLNQVLENTYQPFSLLRNEFPLTRTPDRPQ